MSLIAIFAFHIRIFALVRKSEGSGVLRLKMKGTKLANVEGMFGKSDPFFELSRKVDTAGGLTWDNVYRSKAIKNNLNPDWEVAFVELSVVCGGNFDNPILVQVFDFESSGKHVLMGQFETSVNGLQRAARTGESITLQKKGKASGTITIQQAQVDGVQAITNQMGSVSISGNNRPVATVVGSAATYASAPYSPVAAVAAVGAVGAAGYVAAGGMGQPTFLDYVSGGCEFNVMVAIDFTGSNGDPRVPGTLHYINHGGERNDYEKAIAAIVSILAKFDSDQKFPVFGFGAKYGGVVRHCFQCGPTPEAQGVAGVLDAYHQVFKSGLIMSGPTVFTEVIQTAAARAQSSFEAARARGHQVYTILLILTDGAVSDVRATADCLTQVSNTPLSVVIVGVGRDDFSAMQYLDDNVRGRDIVQFVEFNKSSQHSEQLTKATLDEIPNQLVSFFQSQRIAPLPPLNRSDSQISVQNQEEEIDLSLDIRENEITVVSGGDDFADGFNAGRR